jgi:hypothetical protein
MIDINGTNITWQNSTLDRLTAVKSEPIQCFEGYHNLVVALAMIGICCLYPTAMLTRPMFQALDQNLQITFDYTYLFVFAQIQTVLLVASAFFPNETVLLLSLCFGADLILVGYFWFKKPCTAPLLNTIALIAFGFSAWLNVASLIVVFLNGSHGGDSAPSVMMFSYVIMVFFLIIYGLQVVYFPLDDYKHLNKLEGPEKMQLAISMRTEVALRLFNLITDAEFWVDVVVKSQPAAWQDWTVSGQVCTAVFFLNCAHAVFSTIYFGGLHLLSWYAAPGQSSWLELFPAKLQRFFKKVAAEMKRKKRNRNTAKAKKGKAAEKADCMECQPHRNGEEGETESQGRGGSGETKHHITERIPVQNPITSNKTIEMTVQNPATKEFSPVQAADTDDVVIDMPVNEGKEGAVLKGEISIEMTVQNGTVAVDMQGEASTDSDAVSAPSVAKRSRAMKAAVAACAWCTEWVCFVGDLVLVVGEAMLKAEEIASEIEKAKDHADEEEDTEDAENMEEAEKDDDGDDENSSDEEEEADDGAGNEGGAKTPLIPASQKKRGTGTEGADDSRRCSILRRCSTGARNWLKRQAAAAAGVRLATFILRSTVAMVVFDVMDVIITLVYDDEAEGPITKTAILSALFSAASAAYGLVGRKRDLKVRCTFCGCSCL